MSSVLFPFLLTHPHRILPSLISCLFHSPSTVPLPSSHSFLLVSSPSVVQPSLIHFLLSISCCVLPLSLLLFFLALNHLWIFALSLSTHFLCHCFFHLSISLSVCVSLTSCSCFSSVSIFIPPSLQIPILPQLYVPLSVMLAVVPHFSSFSTTSCSLSLLNACLIPTGLCTKYTWGKPERWGRAAFRAFILYPHTSFYLSSFGK